jgi:transcriptional regulator with XRE-family HTH domain
VAAIDPEALKKAMARAPMTPTQLADQLGISLSYLVRITNGSRRLKRNPVLRRQIADTLDVPVHWIEVERPEPADEVA